MLNNLSPREWYQHSREREWYQQAVHCAQQADAQTDPKVKRQFLELKRLWLLLAQTKRQADTLSKATRR